MEIYRPAYLFNPDGTPATRPSITSAPASVSYGESFNLTTPDNIVSVVLVRNGTVTHAFGMDQREVGLSFTAGSGSLTVTAPPNGNIAPPGYYMLFLLNQSGVPSVASFIQITNAPPTPDFSVTATPSSQNVAPGKSTSYTVNVTPSGGFTGSVSFSVAGLPSGATSSFVPSSVSGSGSSTLTVNASASTAAGTYPLTITATSGSLTHTTHVTLAVADFSISVSPSTQTVRANSKTTYSVTVSAPGPFSSVVTFSISGLPARTSASFSPGSVPGAGTSTLTIFAKAKAPSGTYPLTVSATGGGLTHSTTVNLVVQ
jgi:hypothetical protein